MFFGKRRYFSPLLTALWGAVVAGAVLGRIMDHNKSPPEPVDTEVFSSHPEIDREQLITWGQQFFGKPYIKYPSRTVVLEHIPRSLHRSIEIGNGNENGPPYEVGGRRQTNKKHFQVEKVHFEESLQVKEENLAWMLQNVFMYPRNHNTNETAKEAAKKYIVDSLQVTSGLYTSVQQFQPLQFLNIYDGSTIPMGSNIIGVLKGREWGTSRDRPVLIGAHWDTVNFTPGTDDNGSGVAAMLEAARVISHSGCNPKHSVIFVAFDLEEVGSQGSLVFIKDYLMQIMKTNMPNDIPTERFQGAFIMDTIMDFNDTEGSQTFPTDWSLVLPEVYDQVADNFYKGDFLSMIYRKGMDSRMADIFSKHWDDFSQDQNQKFKLQRFPLSLGKDLPSVDVLADHLNFLRSDHSRFWYMNDTAVEGSLSAVLMTDTGPYRGNMRSCYHTVCDGPEISVYNNPTNLKFLTKITQVLTRTIMDMGECDDHGHGSGTNKHQNFIKTSHVHAKSGSQRGGSPLQNLLNFVRWMELSN